MKILLLNGSSHTSGASARALLEMKKVVLEEGAAPLQYSVGASARYACCACGGCKATGSCIYGDIDSLITLAKEANAIVICTPTHYAAAAGNLLSVLSRLLFSAKSAIEHKPIGVCSVGRRGGLTEAAHDVKKLFEFASCPIISGIYPAILYARDSKSAEYDTEGLENMRSLAKNVLYIARCIEEGGRNGILPPKETREYKTDISALSKL